MRLLQLLSPLIVMAVDWLAVAFSWRRLEYLAKPAAIQAQISTIDFDFWGWAVERWARAVAKLDSDEFGKWLAAV